MKFTCPELMTDPLPNTKSCCKVKRIYLNSFRRKKKKSSTFIFLRSSLNPRSPFWIKHSVMAEWNELSIFLSESVTGSRKCHLFQVRIPWSNSPLPLAVQLCAGSSPRRWSWMTEWMWCHLLLYWNIQWGKDLSPEHRCHHSLCAGAEKRGDQKD